LFHKLLNIKKMNNLFLDNNQAAAEKLNIRTFGNMIININSNELEQYWYNVVDFDIADTENGDFFGDDINEELFEELREKEDKNTCELVVELCKKNSIELNRVSVGTDYYYCFDVHAFNGAVEKEMD